MAARSPGRLAAWLAFALLLNACSGGVRAPVETQSSRGAGPAPVTRQGQAGPGVSTATPADYYRVVPGDTLYSIAWRYGLDYRDVARWNRIRAPYVIVPKQQLLLRAPRAGEVLPSGPRAAPAAPRTATAEPEPARPSAPAGPLPAPAPRPITGVGSWQWPADGRHTESRTTFGKVGLQIHGRRGDAIRAAASGKVVYAGSGLIGYGQLIIIKHNDTFLSAYAHNDALLVKEGTVVTAGQKVALMGNSGSREVMLHFEIRRDGKPVPPLQFLPARPRSG